MTITAHRSCDAATPSAQPIPQDIHVVWSSHAPGATTQALVCGTLRVAVAPDADLSTGTILAADLTLVTLGRHSARVALTRVTELQGSGGAQPRISRLRAESTGFGGHVEITPQGAEVFTGARRVQNRDLPQTLRATARPRSSSPKPEIRLTAPPRAERPSVPVRMAITR